MHIDKEFQSLIPPLTAEEYAGLEESILSEGCRDALVVWGDTLIDGHNRYEICTKHGIPFDTVEMDFPTRDEVIVWIIKNQFGRRNLPAYERARLALRLKPVIAERAKENQRIGAEMTNTGCQKSDKAVASVDTKKELAAVAGLSHDTIAKVEKIEAKAPPEVKEQLRTGAMSINQAYTEIKRQEKAEQRAEKMAALKEKAAVFDGNIVNGDCIAEMEKLADGSVDCVVTDPPYGIEYVSNRRTVESEVIKPVANDGLTDALILWENACKVLSRKMKENSHIYIFTSWKVYPQFAEITGKYFRIKNCLIWRKNNHGTGDLEGNYSEQYEMIIFASKGNRKLNGGRDSNVLEFDKVASASLVHSCEKPVDLLEFLIEKSSDVGEMVIDPFAGSGSTLVAAKNKNRQYWGCELDAENYRIACGRCSQG
jgi:DNA modification methylase/ParB-like chromosome segregation protein Spo0J